MKNTSISFDKKYLYQGDSNLFISQNTVDAEADNVSDSIKRVENRLTKGQYGFIEVLHDDTYIKDVKNVFANLKWAQYMVVIGVGGSDLGGRTIIEAFCKKNSPIHVLFAGDTTDPVAFKRILDRVDLKKTVFNVVSKSGGTLEPLSSYVFFKSQVKKASNNWARHFVFTTSGVKGILKDEAERHNVITLPVPEEVGGRFSVLTPVGLLPALAAGVDIDSMVEAAYHFAIEDSTRKIAQELARSQYELYQQGTKLTVMMTYSVQLQEFARWFRQLWAESLGKDGKGILPIKAWGPADQHSQTQFYNQGSSLQSMLFVKVKKRDVNYILENIDLPEAKFLEGVDFNKIVNIEANASMKSIYNNNRPVAMLSIDQLNEKSLGELFMLFELAVVYLAEMIGVNAFDQPGVEDGKILINQKLGKK
jgi:glucose-6-phosphate isomerase